MKTTYNFNKSECRLYNTYTNPDGITTYHKLIAKFKLKDSNLFSPSLDNIDLWPEVLYKCYGLLSDLNQVKRLILRLNHYNLTEQEILEKIEVSTYNYKTNPSMLVFHPVLKMKLYKNY